MDCKRLSGTVVLTGGCGFIGSHMVEHIVKNTDCNIFILDMLTYASFGIERLRDSDVYDNDRVQLFTFDVSNPLSMGIVQELGSVDYIIHLAAETHVDNSISEPVETIRNNVMSTVYMLEFAKTCSELKKFIYFSTDEVFGTCYKTDDDYKEIDRHRPSNPYSASKSASEQICYSYYNTYNLPIVITNTMNVFGERQHVEKYIPMCVKKILNDEKLNIHTYPDSNEFGSRFYIHARNVSDAVLFVLQNGLNGESYNIRGVCELDNLELANMIARVLGKTFEYDMVRQDSLRPGHDVRYALNGDKLACLGWQPPISLEDSLCKTVRWMQDNPRWLTC